MKPSRCTTVFYCAGNFLDVQLFLVFLTTAREEGVPRGRSEIKSVNPAAGFYIYSMDWKVLDVVITGIILLAGVFVVMLGCMGVISFIGEEEEEDKKNN